MKTLLLLFGSTIFMTACSPQSDIQDLTFPTTSPMHIRALDPHPESGVYVVTMWGFPAVITDDFIPG
jgi:hypothetical protein